MSSEKTKEILYKHSKRRALQRYDLDLTWPIFEQWNQRIRRTLNDRRLELGCLWLAKESQRLSHWLIDDIYIIVFDGQRNAICSFLPPDAINNYLKGADWIKNRQAMKRS
jgi:hypothetical protein